MGSIVLSETTTVASKLLYMEDNPANLRLVQKIITKYSDLELLAAHLGKLGLEIAKTHHPALILLDINLPDLDGFEILRQLQDDPATRDIPVVAISANAMEWDIKRGLDAGFVDYLTKPLDIPKFLAVIDLLLHNAPH
jgi:CheY-like chemotaxis protein